VAGILTKTLAWSGFVVGCALVKAILQQSRYCYESESPLTKSGLTSLTRAAKRANNGLKSGLSDFRLAIED